MPARHDMWWDSLTYLLPLRKEWSRFFVLWCDVIWEPYRRKVSLVWLVGCRYNSTQQANMKWESSCNSAHFSSSFSSWVSKQREREQRFSAVDILNPFIHYLSIQERNLALLLAETVESGKQDEVTTTFPISTPKNFSSFSNLTLLDLTKKTKSLCCLGWWWSWSSWSLQRG